MFPALYVILRHHLRLIKLTQTKVLLFQEFVIAYTTLDFVLQAVYNCRKQLEGQYFNLCKTYQWPQSTLVNLQSGFANNI
jgi:hypothetical protein